MSSKSSVFVLLIGVAALLGHALTPIAPEARAGSAIEIADWHGLNAVRNDLAGRYVLVNDLDSSTAGYDEHAGPSANDGAGWEPIGTLGDGFTGVFDGRGHVIGNLFVGRANANDIGLFGSVGSGGIVTDLGLKDVDVTGYNRVGGLVGANEGTVSRAYSIGEARVKGVYWFAGGLVGMSTPGATITDAYAIGEVSGREFVGGLVGRDEGSVSNSYAIGSVTGLAFVGGLVGLHSQGSIVRSFSGGTVNGSSNVGGLIGRNEGIVHNAYTTSDVTRLSGTNEWFGGFVGRNFGGTIRNAYSAGHVSYDEAEDPEDKGFAGGESGMTAYSGNHFDREASNQNADAVGAATPQTTAAMNDLDTFRDSHWDIRHVYKTDPTDNGYPFLSWQLDGEESVWSIYMERPSFAHGDGSSDNPYRIETAEHLSQTRYYRDAHFVLENDIDLSGFGDEAGWEPIGDRDTPFRGYLDGNGFAIRNLSMDRPAEDNVGLFGYTESGATIVDLDLVDVAITGNRLVGALTGDARNGLRVERVSISGEVVAKGRRAGCLAGTLRADSLVEDVHVSCTMISHDTGNVRMGGFAGELEDDAVIRNSHSAAIVISVHDGDYVGGFTGEMEERAQIIGSHFSGSVSGGGRVGGLAGQAQQDNRIETSWVTGTVTGIEEVGGLVGDLRGTSTIFASYATGTVTGSGECIGGLIGLARRDAEVTDSYAQGPVTGGQYVGGLVGCAVENAAIATTYAIGAVSGMDTGGLVALLQDGATVSSSYYNSETTGQSDTGKGEPRTTAQMRAGMAYTPSETYVHWATPWNISAAVNGGYAYLSALPRFTVAADVTGNGSVQWTGDYPHGATAELVLTPDEGFDLISVSGCGGNLSGNVYTTSTINASCTVSLQFTMPDPGPAPDPDPDPKPDPEFYDDGVVSCAVLGCEAVDMGGQRWVGIEDLVIGDDRTVDIHVVRDLDDATAGVVHELTVRDAEGHALHTTRGESEVPDARTTIDRDGDEQPRVVTRVMLEDGTEVEMIALADGTATHRVILPTDEVTEAVSVVPGAKTRIRADGRVVTRSDGEHCEQPVRAVVETRADGEGVTRFEEFGILSQRWRTHSITIDDTVSRFEPGHNARIEGGACAPRLRVVTPVSRDLYF